MANRPPGPAPYPTPPHLRGPCFAKLLLPDKVTGSVIGRGGQVLAEIEQHSGASLKVSPPKSFFPSTSERMVVVSGEIDGIMRVIMVVLKKLIEHGADSNAMILHMAIPNTSISLVIGKGGEIIRGIQARTGAMIHIADRMDGVMEVVLEVKGPESAVIAASAEVVQIIQSDLRLRDIVPEFYTHGSVSNSHSPPPPPQQAPRSPPQPMDPASNPELLMYPITIEFVVPQTAVGFIEGENRDYLNFVFAQTGAMVSIGSSQAADVTVAIKGPLCGVQAAHILVIKKVTDAIIASNGGM